MANQPEFDKNAASVKIRGYGKGVRYVQNGNIFSSGFTFLEKAKQDKKSAKKETNKVVKKTKVNKTGKKKSRKEIAQAKIAAKGKQNESLKDFKAPKRNDKIKTALQENELAKQAEQNA